MAAVYGEKASHEVKQQLRDKIYRKLLQLGGSYHEQAATSEIIQVSVEGSISWNHIFPVICHSSFTAWQPADLVCCLVVLQLERGSCPVSLCASDSRIDRGSTDICQKTVVTLLGPLYFAWGSFFKRICRA